MLKTPPAEFGEYRYELDRRLGQRVCDGTTRAGVVPGEQTVIDEVAESAGENVRRNAFFVVALQLSEVSAVSEHDVAEHDQAPSVANHFDRGVDRTSRTWLVALHAHCLQSTTGLTTVGGCKAQAIETEGATYMIDLTLAHAAVLLDPVAAHVRAGDCPVVQATLRFERTIAAPAERVWNAYADIAQRSVWSVPDGDAVEYDASDFVQGGVDEYRCGPPDDLANDVTTRYHHIDTAHSFVSTSEIRREGTPVSVDTTLWTLDTDGESTTLSIVVQVTSLVGAGMLDGYRNGHERTLDHLQEFLA